ncbi:ATP-grasp domain-containing protein [Methyloprofundus sp.]|uniref:ATP-grasp domain-containing protein n=1 Tax=Methyloprofundus sp. TaxID=2020875 RepID=UPI003D1189B4
MSQFPDNSGLKSATHKVLVIANSGRMLASLVRSAGYAPLVIDLFADQDTETIAEQVWQVEDLSFAAVRPVIERLLLSDKVQWVIYGSGLENHPETLEYLAGRYNVLGNDYFIIKQMHAKKAFFKQLDILGISYPEVQFDSPGENSGWLIKPVNHLGGLGIRCCDRQAKEHEYYQRYFEGEVGSVLFCADGEQFDLIGFHRQWTVAEDDFTFAGIIKAACLPVEHKKTIRNWLRKLVSFYHLKGLASLDYIYHDEGCCFLEINPRPPASMALYPELDLISAHISGRLTATADNSMRALQIVYATQSCQIQAGVEWPEWSFDRPKANSKIQAGEPLCSIVAQEKTAEHTLAQLMARQIYIENIFFK